MASKDDKKEQKNIITSITKEMQSSFISYAMSVITSRALPDVRDGLKPVHRRILYSMNQNNLAYTSRFKKSAAVVGDVIAKYHPHGDSSVYDAMVGMGQDFSYRYPLILGQGNFGSIDGDPPAAYRYTEAKMSKLSSELLQDLEKNTVDFQPNFDDTKQEPKVLPAAVPTILLNGTKGIAVGMATDIPPHNLNEVIDACIALIEKPQATTEDLLEHIKGPDFPLGGIAYNIHDIDHAYSSGRGSVTVRGEAEIVDGEKSTSQIIITSIPYRVNKSSLITKIAELVRDKKVQGVKALRDESTKDIRIVLDLKSSAQPQKVLNYIYKHTELEQNFNYNMIALVDGVPQTLGLKDIISHFIVHREEVVRRRTQFELDKASARAHILEGLKKALDKIDQVIKIIKASKDTVVAKTKLMKKFKFTDLQTQAILDMKLQKLAGLERKKIEDELKDTQVLIKSLEALLKSKVKMRGVIKKELQAVKEKYGDERRTKIIKQGPKEITDEDLIPRKESALVFTAGGYIKRTDPSEYKAQHRGGVGVADMSTKEEDIVTHMLTADTHSHLLFFSNLGKVYKVRMYDIPEGRRSTKGKSIKNFLPLSGEERIMSILSINKEVKLSKKSLFFATKKGVIKKVLADSFKNVRQSGLIAIKLKEGDDLFSVRLSDKDSSIVLVSKNGQAIRFPETSVRNMGRSASGVRGMKLKNGDEIVGFGVAGKEDKNDKNLLLVITENGFGKKTLIFEYKIQGRGGSGIKTMNINDKTGKIVKSRIVTSKNTELIAVSNKGQVIRMKQEEVPKLGRATQGVKIMKLRASDKVSSITML